MFGTDGFTAWLNSAANPETSTDRVNLRPATPTIIPGTPQTLCNSVILLRSSSTSGNQWYRGGRLIDGATNEEYVTRVPGDYTVVVTAGSYSSEPSAATTVSESPAPALLYQIPIGNPPVMKADYSVPLNGSRTIANIAHDTSASSIVVLSSSTYKGDISVNNTTGAVSISNAAPEGSHTITIQATNDCGAITDATFQLNVVGLPPVLSYRSQTSVSFEDTFDVPVNGSRIINPTAGLSDNTTVASIVVLSLPANTYKGNISVDNTTGVVSISNAAPVGIHIITIRATDDRGTFTDATFHLEVLGQNPPPPVLAYQLFSIMT